MDRVMIGNMILVLDHIAGVEMVGEQVRIMMAVADGEGDCVIYRFDPDEVEYTAALAFAKEFSKDCVNFNLPPQPPPPPTIPSSWRMR